MLRLLAEWAYPVCLAGPFVFAVEPSASAVFPAPAVTSQAILATPPNEGPAAIGPCLQHPMILEVPKLLVPDSAESSS